VATDAPEETRGPHSARVGFATITARTLGAGLAFREALLDALVPGTAHERHRRRWRMGQVRAEADSVVGRIGFVSSGITELFDESINDFFEAAAPAGVTSPFAIAPSSGRVAFQLRGQTIKAQSFCGALQALMNEASDERWRVTPDFEEVDWDTWVQDVDRVTKLSIRLLPPNPNFHGRGRVEEIVDGTNAAMAYVALNADPSASEGLDLTEPAIVEFIDHAAQYGSYSAEAEAADELVKWTSARGAASEIREVPVDPTTKEASPDDLRRELGDQEGG
jgi:hypothetical protein